MLLLPAVFVTLDHNSAAPHMCLDKNGPFVLFCHSTLAALIKLAVKEHTLPLQCVHIKLIHLCCQSYAVWWGFHV